MNELTLTSHKKESAVVLVISAWMVAVSFWVISHQTQIGSINSVLSSIQFSTLFYVYAIVCAFGLMMFKPWAWKSAIVLFIFHALWGLYTVYCLIGIWSGYAVQWKFGLWDIPADIWKTIVCVLVLVYAIWPILVILCLTHPQVKSRFSITDKRFQNLKPTDTRPG